MEVQQLVSIAPWTMIFQILNLLLLTVLFKKFLFKPVTEILDKRKSEIENHYSEAEKAENDAKTLKQGYEAKMAGARQEADQVIKTATDSANVMSGEIIEAARKDAAHIREKAEQEIELEKRKVFNDVKEDLSGIALDIASKVIDREIREEDHKQLIDDFIRNVGEQA
jgi:F-type H+-transporting ATPase subunit b